MNRPEAEAKLREARRNVFDDPKQAQIIEKCKEILRPYWQAERGRAQSDMMLNTYA